MNNPGSDPRNYRIFQVVLFPPRTKYPEGFARCVGHGFTVLTLILYYIHRYLLQARVQVIKRRSGCAEIQVWFGLRKRTVHPPYEARGKCGSLRGAGRGFWWRGYGWERLYCVVLFWSEERLKGRKKEGIVIKLSIDAVWTSSSNGAKDSDSTIKLQ